MTSSLPPDWPLIDRITRIVTTSPGFGLHRSELAERVALSASGVDFKTALMIAYRRKRIDFCGQYAVAPAKRRETP
jgi:hypothetical protein